MTLIDGLKYNTTWHFHNLGDNREGGRNGPEGGGVPWP